MKRLAKAVVTKREEIRSEKSVVRSQRTARGNRHQAIGNISISTNH
jgi:hypothetical protein